MCLVEVDKGKHGVEWLINSLCMYLGLDKHEWVLLRGEREFISFILACIEESISEREFEEGLNSKM